jgi:hypothetical protein
VSTDDDVFGPSGDQEEGLLAYDVNGLREATGEEKTSFRKASKEAAKELSWERPPSQNVPGIKAEEVSRANWLTDLRQRLGQRSVSKYRILLDGEVVRVTTGMG